MTYIYPALFTPCEEGGFHVRFPDLKGTNTEGDTLEESIYMARASLSEWLDMLTDDGEPFPAPSMPEDIPTEEGQFVTLIDTDLTAYRRRKDSRAVKKTLTIPSWMNAMAEEAGLSCSQVLQDALRERFDSMGK